jgi:hypothetical protein
MMPPSEYKCKECVQFCVWVWAPPPPPFLRWWIRKLFIPYIWVRTVCTEHVNILKSTLVGTNWSQSELSVPSEPANLCLINYIIEFCEWFSNTCECTNITLCLYSERLCVDEMWLTCDEGGTSPSSAGPEAVRSHLSWWTASHSWWVLSVKYRRGQTRPCNQCKQFGGGVTIRNQGYTLS